MSKNLMPFIPKLDDDHLYCLRFTVEIQFGLGDAGPQYPEDRTRWLLFPHEKVEECLKKRAHEWVFGSQQWYDKFMDLLHILGIEFSGNYMISSPEYALTIKYPVKKDKQAAFLRRMINSQK